MKTLLIVSSTHHGNSLQVARAMAQVLGAELLSPDQAANINWAAYDIIGFGSGIYSAKHHPALLKLAEALPEANGKTAFLFSTDGLPRLSVISEEYLQDKMIADHAALHKLLLARGYKIAGNFNCAGFNTNSFLKLFGGLNKGRPNADDLEKAKQFAGALKIQ